MDNKVSNISFTARCPQIRKGEWVCHAVNTGLPHLSSTKFNPLFIDFEMNNYSLIKCFRTLGEEPRQLFLKHCSPESKKVITIHNAIESLLNRVNSARMKFRKDFYDDNDRANRLLKQMKSTRIANCSETAGASEIALKMNGVKNSYTAFVSYNGKSLDHSVCIFNKDGSEFTGVVNNKTIIVDPWAGFADFANNAFIRYKNLFAEHLDIKGKGKFGIEIPRQYNLSEKDIEALKQTYPQLVKEGSK